MQLCRRCTAVRHAICALHDNRHAAANLAEAMELSERKDIVRSGDVQGLKYLKKLLPLLSGLHEVGCQRDRAGNRQLHYDQYCVLVLLFLFSPLVRSLRALQQASQLRKVQRKLGVARTSLGSLSEATDVFDPERLQAI